MKNQKKVGTYPGIQGEEHVTSANVSPTVKEPEPVCGLKVKTQKNHVKPKNLAVSMIGSISNMRFGGLWL